ncbi:SDR family oxidoreductase [Nocardia camponoti]|uniref:Thioester reductase (TE) domain-containing protein n=1 Tax=Nocardia camponoti TaxID=1616106 RepID=A0A917VD88_9NOCA|nr:SDR family oxidoreductase [Nocardia camponoti]GGK63194.1 hypothetical protein GCM10011591_39330 [Nocardia camponoti]
MTALVTGATGCVGAGIVLELLRQTSQDIVCIVRSRDDEEAHERLQRVLLETIEAYDCRELAGAVQSRCRGIRGDVTEPRCGLSDAVDLEATELWHLAASLRYLDKHEAAINSVNVDGTRNVITLAQSLGIGVLNYASTVATAGTRTGILYEEPVEKHTEMNNAYERSKVIGEQLVLASGIDAVRILRLPIVVGHSETYQLTASTFSGFYTLATEMIRFKEKVEERLGSYLEHYGVQVVADPDVRNAVLPVDRVANAAVTLSVARAESGIYTLANMLSANIGSAMAGIADVLGIAEPRYVDDVALLTSVDQEFTNEMRFHAPYMLQDKLYDCANLLRYVDRSVVSVEMSRDRFAAYARHFFPAGTESPSQLAATE